MATLALDSCLARFRRAEEHVDALKNAIIEWHKTEPFRLVSQTNQERTRHSLLLRIANPPDLVRWSLIACDALNGFRSSLDHLIYAIARKQGVFELPNPPKERHFSFPICSRPEDFASEAPRCMPKLSDLVRTTVEGIQPYKRQHQFLPSPLALLRDFDNMNKHRLLKLAIVRHYRSEIRNVSAPIPAGGKIDAIMADSEVVDGAEVSALVFAEPTPGVQYHFNGEIMISLEHVPGPPPTNIKWTAIQTLLAEIADEVWRAIQIVKPTA
jgi:hypothetical protein